MTQRHLLFVDNTALTAYRAGRDTVEQEAVFPADETGRAAFADYLATHRRGVFMMLADLVEEAFQSEDIPPTGGGDRNTLIHRKLTQHFYGTSFALACSHGRLKSGRRDERLTLMALTQPQHFQPWLDALRRQRAILAGLWSLPQLVRRLLPAQLPKKLLLLSQSRAGLRQTFFLDGQMRFSRLSPLLQGAPAATASEAEKMHQYLAGQRLIDWEAPLTTWILTHPTQHVAMKTACRSNPLLHYEFIDLTDIAARQGLHSPLDDSKADRLFCHVLTRHRPAEQFAPAGEREFYRLWQMRSGFNTASTVVLVGGLLFAALQGMATRELRETNAQAQVQVQLDRDSYNAKMQALPPVPIGIDNLRALVSRYDEAAIRAPGPTPLLSRLSLSLDAFPAITIDSLDWSVVESLPPPPGQAAGRPAAGPHALLTVAAHLPLAMIDDHRGQLSLVADFLRHLETGAGDHALLLQPPVDTRSGKTLKSDDERSAPEAPRFQFRLARPL